jgi:hypothetical protein
MYSVSYVIAAILLAVTSGVGEDMLRLSMRSGNAGTITQVILLRKNKV